MAPSNIPVFKNSPVTALILSLCTCAIYATYWVFNAAKVVNACAGKEIIPPWAGVLAIICPPIGWYYWYLVSQNLGPIGQASGKPKQDKATLILILGILFSPAAIFLVQTYINEIYEK